MNTTTNNKARADLIDIFNAGLDRVRGRQAVVAELKAHPPTDSPLHVVAIGKAASDMTLGALDVLGVQVVDGLVITKRGHSVATLNNHPRIEVVESDHPVPSEKSLEAGERLLAYLRTHNSVGSHFLFLLSGGASSLVEVLVTGVSLADLKQMTQTLLGEGLNIMQINTVRRALSCIKGGRLANYLAGCEVLNLMISDVPGDNPSVIGSGLLNPTLDSSEDHLQPVAALLSHVNTAPLPDKATFDKIDTRIIACLDNAKQACVERAKRLGYRAHLISEFVDQDVVEAADNLCKMLAQSDYQLLVWGGEPSVNLPNQPGRGGRNQHLALLIAKQIAGQSNTYFVIAGTDGTDGSTSDAGALVDGATVERGQLAGLDLEESLVKADSGHFLERSGDLITTGPTGTNVMDLMIALH